MKLKHLLKESEEEIQPLPKDQKQRLRNKLKGMFDVIEKFERNGEIHKDDKDRVDTFKDFISDMVKEGDREKIIKGSK